MSLFSFSSILSVKYSQGRVKPLPNFDIETTQSNHTIQIETPCRSMTESKLDTTVLNSDFPKTKKSKKKSKNKCCPQHRFFIPILIASIILIIAGTLTAVLMTTLYRSETSFTTTSTKTTTTTRTTTTTTTTTTTSTTTSTSITTSSTTTTDTTTTTTTSTDTTTTTDSTTTPACYFGGDYVSLVGGGLRQIRNLKAGDRLWTISEDGQTLIEDEVMCVPHASLTTPTNFYTFTTVEGDMVSLTDSHFIWTISDDEKTIHTKPAAAITLKHRLIKFSRSVQLAKITYSQKVGYYSPITISGSLTVSNLSTSVYVDCLHGSHQLFHQIAAPFRWYYSFARILFGKDFIPYEMTIDGELHPISQFIIGNYKLIRMIFAVL